jgi:cell division septation protein DedD
MGISSSTICFDNKFSITPKNFDKVHACMLKQTKETQDILNPEHVLPYIATVTFYNKNNNIRASFDAVRLVAPTFSDINTHKIRFVTCTLEDVKDEHGTSRQKQTRKNTEVFFLEKNQDGTKLTLTRYKYNNNSDGFKQYRSSFTDDDDDTSNDVAYINVVKRTTGDNRCQALEPLPKKGGNGQPKPKKPKSSAKKPKKPKSSAKKPKKPKSSAKKPKKPKSSAKKPKKKSKKS